VGSQGEPGRPGLLGAAPEGASIKVLLISFILTGAYYERDLHVTPICVVTPFPLKTNRTSMVEENFKLQVIPNFLHFT